MMSLIAGDLFADSPVLVYALLALAIQFTVFCGVSLRALFRDRSTVDALARMPLNDEETVHE